MSYPINYPTPQGANIQTFTKSGAFDWVKPQGASFVWFTLIGAGGGGGGGDGDFDGGGGGSGAVTNFMCPAFLIPDVLRVSVGAGGEGSTNGFQGQSTNIVYQQKDGTGYTLLTANGGGGGTRGGNPVAQGATAMTANYFTPIGFFQSVSGQNGSNTDPGISGSTFLGGGGNNQSIGSNYGYSRDTSAESYGQLQPIIVSSGGGCVNASGIAQRGSFGSGGGASRFDVSIGGRGGDGLVVIITW
jgi:hypothetical protein